MKSLQQLKGGHLSTINGQKFWANYWRISLKQVKDLLGVTGSYRIEVLQNYLKNAGLLPDKVTLNS